MYNLVQRTIKMISSDTINSKEGQRVLGTVLVILLYYNIYACLSNIKLNYSKNPETRTNKQIEKIDRE